MHPMFSLKCLQQTVIKSATINAPASIGNTYFDVAATGIVVYVFRNEGECINASIAVVSSFLLKRRNIAVNDSICQVPPTWVPFGWIRTAKIKQPPEEKVEEEVKEEYKNVWKISRIWTRVGVFILPNFDNINRKTLYRTIIIHSDNRHILKGQISRGQPIHAGSGERAIDGLWVCYLSSQGDGADGKNRGCCDPHAATSLVDFHECLDDWACFVKRLLECCVWWLWRLRKLWNRRVVLRTKTFAHVRFAIGVLWALSGWPKQNNNNTFINSAGQRTRVWEWLEPAPARSGQLTPALLGYCYVRGNQRPGPCGRVGWKFRNLKIPLNPQGLFLD